MAGYFQVVGLEQPAVCLSGTSTYYSSAASSPYTSPFDPYSSDASFPPHDIVMDDNLCYPTPPYHHNAHSQSPIPWDARPPTSTVADSYNTYPTTLFPDYHTPPERRSPAQPISQCPSLSPRSLKRDSPCEDIPLSSVPSPRKRGRPRLSQSRDASGAETQRSTCLPHKQVERKYREGLNMEFERLRRAVPTLPQSMDANVMGASKPSKGMVLAAAIEYIKRVERERDAAIRELEMVRGEGRTGAGGSASARYQAR